MNFLVIRRTLKVISLMLGLVFLPSMKGCDSDAKDSEDKEPEPVERGVDVDTLIFSGQNSNTTCAIVGEKANLACWGEFMTPIAVLPPEPAEVFGGDDGLPPSNVRSSVPFLLESIDGPPIEGVTDVAVRSNTICAIQYHSFLTCWGSTSFDEESVDRPFFGEQIAIDSLAEINNIALSASGYCIAGKSTADKEHPDKLICWGHQSGQSALSGLGVGDSTIGRFFLDDVLAAYPEGVPLPDSGGILDLEAGQSHYCVILKTTDSDEHGDVTCWGSNNTRQLGNNAAGPIGETNTPRDAGLIDFSDAKVKQLALGDNFSCALLEEPKDIFSSGVRCWGAGTSGVLGYPRAELELFEGEPWGDRVLTYANGYIQFLTGPIPFDVTLGREYDDQNEHSLKVRKLVAGASHVCALIKSYDQEAPELNTAVRCWGSNNTGVQDEGGEFLVGGKFRGDTRNQVPDPDDIFENSATLIENLGDLPIANPDEEIRDIALGRNHNCTIVSPDPFDGFYNDDDIELEPGELGVKCWGRGREGQLGNGDFNLDSGEPKIAPDIPFDFSFNFIKPDDV